MTAKTTLRISQRVQRIEPSLTLTVTHKAQVLQRQGVDVLSFGAGEPDFDTPAHIKAAAVAALGRGATKYAPVPGIPELRRAIADEFERAHGVPYAPEEILVSCGAKHVLFNVMQALCDEGDEVIVPTPCWVSHTELVRMAGGTPVLLELRAEDGFQLDVAALERRITPRTRAIMLCSPCNPTGAVYSPQTVAQVGALVLERARQNPDLFIVTDDLYRRLVYGGARWSSVLHSAPELKERVVVVDGVSKAYAMTGWRIGYCGAPRQLVGAMQALQGQMVTSATTVAQYAALAALTGDQAEVGRMAAEFDLRRQVMHRALAAIPQVVCTEPQGAFYCFPDLRAYLGQGNRPGAPRDDLELAEWLLQGAHIAAVPGSAFFGPGYLRFSYATSMAAIEEGMRRLGAALKGLAQGL